MGTRARSALGFGAASYSVMREFVTSRSVWSAADNLDVHSFGLRAYFVVRTALQAKKARAAP